jgi:hypothetical protein
VGFIPWAEATHMNPKIFTSGLPNKLERLLNPNEAILEWMLDQVLLCTDISNINANYCTLIPKELNGI